MTWKDTTSYSKGKERIQSAWTFENDSIRVTILNNHRYYPKKWVIHCFTLGIKEHVLKIPFDTPVEEVKNIALNLIKKRLEKIVKSLN